MGIVGGRESKPRRNPRRPLRSTLFKIPSRATSLDTGHETPLAPFSKIPDRHG